MRVTHVINNIYKLISFFELILCYHHGNCCYLRYSLELNNVDLG